MRTAFELSVTIRDHLTKQKARAVDPITEACEYLTSNGLMCAVGCLIPIKDNPEQLKGSVRWLVEDKRDKYKNQELSNNLTLLESWQSYHDNRYTTAGVDFSYERWLKGDEAHSPTAFHEAAIKEFNIIQTPVEKDNLL